jgi:integrase/recombinase XerD
MSSITFVAGNLHVRIDERDVISKAGTRFEEIGLTGSITKGCRPRSIYLSHAKAIEAFDRYVEWRYRRGLGVRWIGANIRA